MLYKMAMLIFEDDDFELSVMEVTRYAYKLIYKSNVGAEIRNLDRIIKFYVTNVRMNILLAHPNVR